MVVEELFDLIENVFMYSCRSRSQHKDDIAI